MRRASGSMCQFSEVMNKSDCVCANVYCKVSETKNILPSLSRSATFKYFFNHSANKRQQAGYRLGCGCHLMMRVVFFQKVQRQDMSFTYKARENSGRIDSCTSICESSYRDREGNKWAMCGKEQRKNSSKGSNSAQRE